MLVRGMIFLALNALDALLTVYITRQTNGCVYELNPVAFFMMSQLGFFAFLMYKLLCTTVITLLVYKVFRPESANRIMTVTCVGFGAFMVYMSALAFYCTFWTF